MAFPDIRDNSTRGYWNYDSLDDFLRVCFRAFSFLRSKVLSLLWIPVLRLRLPDFWTADLRVFQVPFLSLQETRILRKQMVRIRLRNGLFKAALCPRRDYSRPVRADGGRPREAPLNSIWPSFFPASNSFPITDVKTQIITFRKVFFCAKLLDSFSRRGSGPGMVWS